MWSGHFADLLLIPAGLPLWLWLERRIGWRRDDQMPRWREITFALITWTCAAELIAPRMFSQATGDGWDAVAYACGAVVAGLWWQRDLGLARRRGKPGAAAATDASQRVERVQTTGPCLSQSGTLAG